jgi:GNAT superfamily N-acetyltransferase
MKNLERISEEVERAALKSLHEHCPEEVKVALGLHLLEVADGLLAAAENDPSILLNRTVGLGIQASVEPNFLKEVTEKYKKIGITSYFLHLYESDLSDETRLSIPAAGLKKTRGWMKFQRDTSPANDSPTTLNVEMVGSDRAKDFGQIVCNAFGMTDAAIPLLAGLANDPRWYLFVSYEGDAAAGAGALFVTGDKAWIEWGATNPEFRRRGSQAAIMEARLTKAKELGCTYIFTETGEAVEGDAQHSYKNILKHGFVETRLRENFEPEKA